MEQVIFAGEAGAMTPEAFRKLPSGAQLDHVLNCDAGYLQMYLELNSPLPPDAEARLLAGDLLDIAAARHVSEYDGDMWCDILRFHPEWMPQVRFEDLEPEAADKLLLHYPELTGQSGLVRPRKLVLHNPAPEPDPDGDIPIACPRDRRRARALIGILRECPGMDYEDAYCTAYQALHHRETSLGIYAAERADSLRRELCARLDGRFVIHVSEIIL